MSGFSNTSLLGKYLGVPLIGKAPKKEVYKYIIDQVGVKLTMLKGLCPRTKDSCGWLLGNGRSLDAWDTRWIAPNIRVVDLDLEILTHLREAKVADLLDINGEWYWDILNHWLLQNIMGRMEGMTSLCTEVGPNAQIVIGDDNNVFLMKMDTKPLLMM
ncbi:hypothetical protein KIW84_014818 [Lathyrus oleraceus]|uniref:Uncharacterized protein n=1 Tax=Pisum sativum TaxID=3888 RepID=A0A9D5GZW7_PEA|nr:hypothetical protein KIW84_014818 [Pisum sativum]